MSTSGKRYLLLRVPSSGPKALAGAPNDFPTREDAERRLAQIISSQLKVHHTYLEIVAYRGDKATFLEAEGILA
ncbi:hypothetical protein POI8812_02653 [Pontivivens insulae]|uniref:Uncharacterized protein n=1 Tax=Pontivivens insulae TaxID=1639689 RepID=A0A2R8ADK2_9RHOB|nr:hypothetical protein DFR53_1598 [Pontivivens insulae]SPF30317.1 hypothetical protein POI8812_02653 [Pontivivens insulae]